MRIYSMTATFGKLNHTTLELKPGLNVFHAPNEWGKSTWCAFLVNMLYGIDTRARSGGTVVPDKERYAPWSGAPMSGRIELNWNGRDITIERTSNARTPMGVFRAYETQSGVEVPELTASNCGQMLLGVERSVFSQAGFIRQSDLPVVQDDALRRRLNSLVTTGDESGAADRLGQTLKDLKNKCRSNKANGLIPEAEERREELRKQLDSLQDLQQRTEDLQKRQKELEVQIHQLENHKAALDYARYMEDREKLERAKVAQKEAHGRLTQLEEEVAKLPEGEDAELLQQADLLMQEQLRLQIQKDTLPQKPQKATEDSAFTDMEQVSKDLTQWQKLQKKKKQAGIGAITGAIAAVLAVAGMLLSGFTAPLSYILTAVAVIALIVVGIAFTGKSRAGKQGEQIRAKYPGKVPDRWLAEAETCARQNAQYDRAVQEYEERKQALLRQEENLQQRIQAFAGDEELAGMRTRLQQAQRLRRELEAAQRENQRAEAFVKSLEEMTQEVAPSQEPDVLQYSRQQTVEILESARFEQRQVLLKLAQCEGQRQLQGQEPQLRSALEREKQRIARLEEYYDAIELAQSALSKAGTALQRRFAPKITKRTQELFKEMTGERYTKVVMAENMRLSVATADEDTLRDAQRRSDGTVDQLYLALRLAVAEELTPAAPVVLDDALVRFDDTRLASAMDILSKTAEGKQVIVFTCQSREDAREKGSFR